MSWLDSMLPVPEQLRIPEGSQEQILQRDSSLFRSNQDLLVGCYFAATLLLRTSSKVLEHHGEFHLGPPDTAPFQCDLADGIWIASAERRDWRQQRSSSAVGAVIQGEFVPFLKEFRRIVEGP